MQAFRASLIVVSALLLLIPIYVFIWGNTDVAISTNIVNYIVVPCLGLMFICFACNPQRFRVIALWAIVFLLSGVVTMLPVIAMFGGDLWKDWRGWVFCGVPGLLFLTAFVLGLRAGIEGRRLSGPGP